MTVTVGAYKYGGQIERAAMATLQKWLRTHLGLLEAELGYEKESLPDPPPSGWGRRTNVDIDAHRPENSTPAVIVTAGGTTGVQRDGDGSYDAMWEIQVGVIVSSATEEDTRDMAGLYAVAIRTCLTQHTWEQAAVSCRWAGERYDLIDTDSERTIAGAACVFDVYTDAVLTTDAGPTTPEPLPDPTDGDRPTYPEPPTAETVTITVDPL